MLRKAEENVLEKKIHPAHIGFDFDGVIADIAEAFIRLSFEQYGYTFTLEEITHFNVEHCLDIDPKAVEEIFTRILVDSVATGLQPMPGAVEVLEELTGYTDVTIITARSEADPVLEWLEMIMPKAACQKIKVVAMGLHDDKPRYVREHGLRFFVDDRVETCHQLDREGIHPIVFAQPWNMGRHSYRIVNSWQEIRDLSL